MRRATVLATLLLVAVFAAPLQSTAAPAPASELQTAKGVTKPDFPDQITEEYRVNTEHGTLYGWVTRPDPNKYPDLYSDGQGTEGAGIPVVLTLSPYNSLYQPVAGGPHVLTRDEMEYFSERGYAYAQFDIVGVRESGGCYDYGGIRERETGAAIIDFLGGEPDDDGDATDDIDWSNGNVGMIGGSYDGTTQIAAAIEQPKHLKAIIPQVAIDRWYDYAYTGGVRHFLNSENPSDQGFDTPFAFDFGFAAIPPTSDDAASVDVLATRVNPCDRIEHTQRGYQNDPVYDEFWEERDYRRSADRITVPTFVEGGWLDHNVKHWDSTRFYMSLPKSTPKMFAIGQWAHSGSQFKGAQDLRHAWFDKWLLGFDTGVLKLPPVTSQANTGAPTQYSDWPPPGTERVKVPLLAKPSPGALGLDGDDPSYRDIEKTLDEREALDGICDGRCLLFSTEPLTQGVRISGGPILSLRATTDAASTHYSPVVFDQAPDGTLSIISRGFLNTRNRNGLDKSQELTPDKEYTAPVPIWDVDYRVAKGHRLGVAVMSANSLWALPEDDSAATNTINIAGESFLALPISEGAFVLEREARRARKAAREEAAGKDSDGPGSGVGDAGASRNLPATGAGAALPGLALMGLSAAVLRRRRD